MSEAVMVVDQLNHERDEVAKKSPSLISSPPPPQFIVLWFAISITHEFTEMEERLKTRKAWEHLSCDVDMRVF